MRPPDHDELERFRGVIAGRLGLQFDNGKREWLADVLRQRLLARGCDQAGDYLESLSSPAAQGEELRALACHLTVTETYFFRGSDHFRVLAETAVPQRIRARAAARRLRFLSAGCASGEEAYSLAILLRERFPELASWEVEIRGVDLNGSAIAKARAGRYNAWSLRDTPAELIGRYFHAYGRDYVLDEQSRSMVEFSEQNLVSGEAWACGEFDVILCRNVIMYLAPDAVRLVVAGLTRALAPAGFLFLGHAETLRGISQDFQLQQTHGAFYYCKRGGQEDLAAQPRSATVPEPLACAAWMDGIRAASERIRDISRQEQPAGITTEVLLPNEPAGSSAEALSGALDLLRKERFGEALEALRGLPRESSRDPDTQLLRAVLLTNRGELAEAEAVCRQVLSADDLNAGAHYLSALCSEHAGDATRAMEHDRAAIYLDGDFAMPHLHLGRLAKRSADLLTARRELERAASLLLREDASRILLFGGGFTRDALVAFTRAELESCGGALWSL